MALGLLVLWFDKRGERYSWVLLPFSLFLCTSGIKGLCHSIRWQDGSVVFGWIAAVCGMIVAVEIPSIVYYFTSFASPSQMASSNKHLAHTVSLLSEQQDRQDI